MGNKFLVALFNRTASADFELGVPKAKDPRLEHDFGSTSRCEVQTDETCFSVEESEQGLSINTCMHQIRSLSKNELSKDHHFKIHACRIMFVSNLLLLHIFVNSGWRRWVSR
jgi:hypothetical protein